MLCKAADILTKSEAMITLGRKRIRLKKTLLFALVPALALTALSPSVTRAMRLPGQVTLTKGQFYTLPRGITAHASADETLSVDEKTITASDAGTSTVQLSLFGVIPIRDMQVEVTKGRTLIPGGQSVGLGMQMEGVMVVGVASGSDAAQKLKPGDTVLSLNGQRVTSAEQITQLVSRYEGQTMSLSCLRDGEAFDTKVRPLTQDGAWRLGIWVRSSTAGVGTLTYYDPEKGVYGALGHSVSDSDTGRIFTVRDGKLWRAQVVDVKKGLRGAPGELRGSFLKENRVLGTIEKNTVFGVYGKADAITSPLYSSGLPVASRSSVHTGKATILSTVDDAGVRAYQVEIVEVARQKSPSPKSFVIRVTDPALIEKTGGIVQGMSGSPVIQDGHLVGAVTHVFVDDPLMGYGLYIEWMLEESDETAFDKAA